ncbi:MAG: GNAT family N-acetyltransferase [Euryarchaeota archaeon]|nr:GNAT family N-acetyltransferase [Euryarchaeota archaeon]MDE2043760.1 GNAT family N-acetyltransferase [Thermoplasmata archaeon]
MPKGVVYLVRTQIAPEREAEWDQWHRQSHVPEVLAERGFRRARRLRMVEGDEPHRYWTLYDLESADALQAYRQSPAAMRLAAQHDQKFGHASNLKRSTLEVLDDLRAPIAPSEAAVVGGNLHLMLRAATTADENAVLTLLKHLFDRGTAPPGFTEAQARSSFRQYLGDPDSGLFVAEVGGRVSAFATATTYPTMRFGRRGHVEDLVVDPEFRTKGVGHRLLEYVERWARREGVTHLSTVIGLHREESRKFLTQEGFSDASLVLRKRWATSSGPPI